MITFIDRHGIQQVHRVTEEHPYFRVGAGWVPSRVLGSGETVRGGSGILTVIENVLENHPNGVKVFNVTAKGAHTYFVRGEGSHGDVVWVHNQCAGWENDLSEIEERVARLADRAVQTSGGDWVTAESTFRGYTDRMNARLSANNSNYVVEWQPAAVRGSAGVRTWSAFGDDGWSVSPRGSARLDAGIADLTSPNGTMRGIAGNETYYPEIVSGFDITVNPGKASRVGYYQDAFGNININEIGPGGR